MQLYSRVATEFSIEAIRSTGKYLRELVDTDRLLFIIREYYDLAAAVAPPEGGADQWEGEMRATCAHVRPYLLLILKAYFTKVRR